MRTWNIRCCALASMALCTSAALGDVTYSFFSVTNTSATNVAWGTAQLKMTVSPAAGGVDFLFQNVGLQAMSITDVYFDDGTLLALSSVTNGPGVDFAQGASPPNLPGGNNASPPFETTVGFLADSNPPAQPNGVNPGEWLRIFFTLQSGGVYADVVDELADGRLRVGIHVQGYGNGGSESFVNHMPAPSGLGLAVLGGLLAARRRR